MRLAAIRNKHVSYGFPDPVAHMPRVPLALSGLMKRAGTTERRHPVTPVMLRWIRDNLRIELKEEEAILWAGVALGFFFLLRASEYLDVGYTQPGRGLLGRNLELKENGKPCTLSNSRSADEVVLTIRGSKTDVYNRGETRNHFKGDDPRLCVVRAVVALYEHHPKE